MNNTPSNGYNPVTNYMDVYGNAVSYDPETRQYVSNGAQAASSQTSSAASAASAPAAATSVASAPAYAAPGAFVAPPSMVSSSRIDPLDGTVQTSSARKPFRRLVSLAGFSLVLYIVFDYLVGYLLIYLPYIFNLGKALANTDAGSLWSQGQYLDAYRTVIEYVQSIIPQNTLDNMHMAASMIAAVCASVFPMLILAKKSGFKPFSVFKKGRRYGRGLTIKALCAAFAVAVVWSLIYAFLSSLISGVSDSTMGMDMPESILGIILYCTYVVIFAPFLEEFIFRGVMLKALTPYGTFFAAMVTSLLFGLLHGNLQQAPFAFGVGLVFAYVAIKTGSIRTGILLHFIVNGVSTLVQLISIYCIDSIVTLASALVGLVYIAAVITTVVVLIVDRKRISYIQEPAEWNNIVRPVNAEQPPKKWLNAFTTVGMLLFLAYILFAIAASANFFMPD